MIGKFVRIGSPELVQYFYPDFVIREELSFLDQDKKVIFTGKARKDYLDSHTKQWICVSGSPEIDYTDKAELVNWVFSVRGKEPTRKILGSLDDLDLSYVEYLCKIYWLCGRWVANVDECDKNIYDLFMSSIESVGSTLRTYFELRKVYPYEVIEASFITFLSRVNNADDDSGTEGYKRLRRQARQRFGSKIRSEMVRLGSSEDNELSFINMMLRLRG